MKLLKLTLPVILAILIVSSALAMNAKPGEGVTLRPARATWSTGFFQEALARRGLEELGYDVKKTKNLQNPIAYKSIYLGDIDYWCNGNFPLHNEQLPKNFEKKAVILDPIIKAGGMQGYLVSKKEIGRAHV